MPSTWTPVHPQFGIMVHGSDNHIDAAISIKVAEGTPSVSCGGRIHKAGLGSESLPLAAFSWIAKHRVGLLHCGCRWTRRRDMASGHKQVFPSIVVKVVKPCPEARHFHAQRTHSTAGSHLDKLTLSGVLQ